VRDAAGQPLRAAAAVAPGAKLAIEFADGRIGATADGTEGAALSPKGAAAKEPAPKEKLRKVPEAGQGKLF
jgi:exodeoxyribonuclease VII large subunit